MRCSECDRIVREQSVARLKDGRIVFGWCVPCVDVADAERIELTDRVRLFGQGEKVAIPFGGTSWEHDEARSHQRIFALTVTAASLAGWGLMLAVAGFLNNDDPTPAQPQGTHIGILLVCGGGSLMGMALGLFLAARRARSRHVPARPVDHKISMNPLKSETAL